MTDCIKPLVASKCLSFTATKRAFIVPSVATPIRLIRLKSSRLSCRFVNAVQLLGLILSFTEKASTQAEGLLVAGSALGVQPAAGLLDYYEGNKMAIINDQPTPYDARANLVIRDRIGAVIEQLL